ncbi:hypothetical protein VZQ01_10075 [Myxococcus faecalis]|uniref:hypothetical protein n=1 Tax=Myxococcus faecalis TaxID=3115646 RepID=UPI003CF92B31
MHQVLERIAHQKLEFSRRPLFAFLRDTSIPPRERLSFLPLMSHFIMSFGDLNRYVLSFPEPRDALEEAVNLHTREDENHWPWFLNDLEALELNGPRTLTHHLRQLWSDDTAPARRLTYTLAGCIRGTSALQRWVLIEVMEETGNVMFRALTPVAKELEEAEGLRLEFAGSLHLSHETGHAVGFDVDHSGLLEARLTPRERAPLLSMVDASHAAFSEFVDALYRATPRGRRTAELPGLRAASPAAT